MDLSLIYVSRKAPSVIDPKAAVEDIVRVSQERNTTRNLTGALASTADYYVQLLEGQRAAIEDLMHRIELDDRHTDVIILQEALVTERSLPDWTMAYCGSSTYVVGRIEAALLSPECSASLRVDRLRSLLVGLATVGLSEIAPSPRAGGFHSTGSPLDGSAAR